MAGEPSPERLVIYAVAVASQNSSFHIHTTRHSARSGSGAVGIVASGAQLAILAAIDPGRPPRPARTKQLVRRPPDYHAYCGTTSDDGSLRDVKAAPVGQTTTLCRSASDGDPSSLCPDRRRQRCYATRNQSENHRRRRRREHQCR